MATFIRTRATLQNPGVGPAVLLTYYWDSAGGTGTAIVTEAMARVRAFWASFAGQVPSGSVLTFNTVGDEIEETNGQIVNQYTGTLPAAVAFSLGTDGLPLQTQGLLRLQTATFVNGRRLGGRQFIPYPGEIANANGGIPTSTYLTALNTAAALLGTTVVTPVSQRIWHRPQGGSGGLTAVVTARSASSQWAVLKSRRA